MVDPWAEFPIVPQKDPWAEFPIVPSASTAGVAPVAAVPAAKPSSWDKTLNNLDYAAGTAAVGLRGARRGFANLAGAPVDLVNFIMKTAGVPTSSTPFLGSTSIDAMLGVPAEIMAYATGNDAKRAANGPVAQDKLQRVVGRVGEEIGASAIPIGAAISGGVRVGAAGSRAMQNQGGLKGVLGSMYEAGAVNPVGLARREAAFAAGAGTGAGLLNEAVGNPQSGNNFWSDFTGSLLGSLGLGAGIGTVKQGAGLVNAAVGRPVFRNDVLKESVATDLMANSSRLQQQFGQTGNPNRVDTSDLAQDLRRPSAAEELVPGFRANVADRAQDAGLSRFAFDREAGSGSYGTSRRADNEAAISQQMQNMSPQGDPAQFRAALETNRDRRIMDAEKQAEMSRAVLEAAMRGTLPEMADATMRGSVARSALQEVRDSAKQGYVEKYKPINESTVTVNATPLLDSFEATRSGLPINDQARFLPSELNTVKQFVEPSVPPSTSAILGPDGVPLQIAGVPASGEVPLKEIASVRSGLTDDIRAARATPGQDQKAAVADKFRANVDEFLDNSIPAELRTQYNTANAARRDFGERFQRPGTAMQRVLQRREGGGYALDDSAVTKQFVPTDQGKLTDFRDAMREAGTDVRLRDAISDEVLSEAQRRNVVSRPEALQKFLSERSIVLSEFPDLKKKLETAGSAKQASDMAMAAAETTKRDLTTPSRSPEADYLQYGDAATVDAVRSVIKSKDPEGAMTKLIQAAGGTPDAYRNARSALWEDIKTKKYANVGVEGTERWNANQLKAFLDDPKTAAAAKVAWADRPPNELEDIKKVFNALAGSELSSSARVPGTSGTAQGLLSSGFDARSISSSLRSVNQGRSSPVSEFLYQAQGLLRNRSAKMQKEAIQDLTNQVINRPGLAADLLESFNPIEFAAKKRMLTQKYGLRGSQFMNALDEEDEVKNKVMEQPLQLRVKPKDDALKAKIMEKR